MLKKIPHILIVDDEKQIRDLLYNILKTQRFVVSWAKNGVEALEILKNKQVDLVVTDISMPNMDGNELSNKIRFHYKNIPVIILSALGTKENFIRAIKHGAVDFLVKGSFDPSMFVDRINTYLNWDQVIHKKELDTETFAKKFAEIINPVDKKETS